MVETGIFPSYTPLHINIAIENRPSQMIEKPNISLLHSFAFSSGDDTAPCPPKKQTNGCSKDEALEEDDFFTSFI